MKKKRDDAWLSVKYWDKFHDQYSSRRNRRAEAAIARRKKPKGPPVK